MIKEADKKLLNSIGVDVYDKDRNYWFIRTQGGLHYNEFYNNDFVGIEWDEISDLKFIQNTDESILKQKVEEVYNDVQKPGYIVGQIKKFMDIKVGDIVLIPSEGSEYLAIGEVIGDVYIYEEDNFTQWLKDDQEKSIIKKRCNVKWLKEFKRSDWDPYLTRIIYSNSAIVDANKYDLYIDRMLSQFYIKGNDAYFTYKVNKKENIPYTDMLSLLNNNNKLLLFFEENYPSLGLDLNEIIVKINVQSKGPVQFKGPMMKILVGGMLISFFCGAKFNIEPLGVSIETEGIPGLINSVLTAINQSSVSEKSDELQEIISGINIDKEKLEIQLPNTIDEKDNN